MRYKGCQRVYTMIANTTVETPSCANVTFPLGPLDVDAKVSNGPLSQYGWIPEVCSRYMCSQSLCLFK